MTKLAVPTERARVNVVAAVAIAAAHRYGDGVRRGSRVASVTVETFMGAVEHKTGLLVMIELPNQPVVGVVAEVAVRTETLLVDIVCEMAVDALVLGFAERRIRVTALARNCSV